MLLFTILSAFCATVLSKPSLDYEGRIVNGIPTTTEEYPFIVDMRLYYEEESGEYITDSVCTGSLIRLEYPATILTAAHCLFNVTAGIVVYLRRSDQDANFSSTNNFTSYFVMDFVLHPDYNHTWAENDIALMFLNESLENDGQLDVVELPEGVTLQDECCSDGESLEVIGYGLDGENGTGISFINVHTDTC